MGKKIGIVAIAIIIIALIIGGIYYFLSNNENVENQTANINEQEENNSSNTLVAYYSYTGNTEEFANIIAEETGGTLFEIQRAEEYSDLYEEAEEEINNNEKPELASMPENVEQYDTIFIGYPIWWDRAPAMINTFLDNINLEGKTVIPFCTSSSDGIEGSMTDIRNSAGEANILEGLRLSGSGVESSRTEIQNWLSELGI